MAAPSTASEVRADQPATGRRERKKAETRQALVAAARRLFLERGYDEVTVAQIADEADTAVTTLFNHFPDGKEALVFGDTADENERALSLAAAVRGTGSVPAALEALRRFFEVDRFHIAHAAVAALAAEGKMNSKDVARALKQYKLDGDKPNPLGI